MSTATVAAKSLQLCPTLQPHRRQPTRLPCPWDSPGKNTGVGCHFLLQCMKVKSQHEVTQLCPTLRDPMDCSLPGSSIHGIFQARVLEWGAIDQLGKKRIATVNCSTSDILKFPSSKWSIFKVYHSPLGAIRNQIFILKLIHKRKILSIYAVYPTSNRVPKQLIELEYKKC